jgi:predicted nucleic acid-binding protein
MFGWYFMPERCSARASEVQELLTAKGTHRSAGAVDLLVAATAELHGLILLHHDHDFDCVAAVTGQPTEWLDDQA